MQLALELTLILASPIESRKRAGGLLQGLNLGLATGLKPLGSKGLAGGAKARSDAALTVVGALGGLGVAGGSHARSMPFKGLDQHPSDGVSLYMHRVEASGITIDDKSTRDIDDAIQVDHEGPNWRVQVSIADVASAVRADSNLDLVARERAATRYFATGNSPMLPRNLSDDDLSLWPGKVRNTLTIEVNLDAGLEPVGECRLLATVLRSKAKLAYAEIPAILKDSKHEHHGMLTLAVKLAFGLLERRRAAGAMALYDLNNGWVSTEEGFLRKLNDRLDTTGYIIVQELMILANAALARLAVANNIPVLYRNHEARLAAPDRQDLMRQLNDALATPMGDLDMVRQRTHMLLDKASYGGKVMGHYGLNLPAYMHFTSPIRRYPDLVNQRQFMAWLKEEAPPHDAEAVEAIGQHVNESNLADDRSRSEHMKGKAERKAQYAIDARRLDGLSPKDFERVTKLEARSGNDPSEAFVEAVMKRLRDGRMPMLCSTVVLIEAPRLDGWKPLRTSILQDLAHHPQDAVSILMQAQQGLGWPAPVFESHPVGAGFEARVTLGFADGPIMSDPMRAQTVKQSKQWAALNALAKALDMPCPALKKPKGVAPVAEGREPVGALHEWCQGNGATMPEYTFEMSGPPHAPKVECTARVSDHSASGEGASKQEAKRAAAKALLARLASA